MFRRQRSLVLSCLGLYAVVLLSGCQLTVPAADPTPPSVGMTVFGLGDPVPVNSDSGPVTRSAPAGAEVVLLATGTDTDGGVKDIRINGAATVSCSGGEFGQAISVHYIANNPEDPEIGPGDTASDRRFTNLTIKVDDFKNFCTGDLTFDSVTAGFVATAENFHGGTASTPAFTLNHP